ncbi:MAG: ribosome-associated translation inhibitor RaiA [Deltaproteobacteria bacterium]|jgi:putative sigma-54 modulation protein|nr:ribosome-associated translation inhibitor RaiA [Deltaproteobacteria bacterium]MBT4089978.1 ribosome-associated translation inhibitor RaiA [Deltaproteobacteria bacterium]MBT4268128.1 ribosome-associated translation inhibitor RaiA [Deltaproteobacteria bacterium]MBT4640243.1 ribosome-associated translation inhibitor RaiA [Deltaproteobacteria bacterium]MBT6502015.1 ribosome-associated translation inhibitor RaiA [Deltaproteobacteria bacterium]
MDVSISAKQMDLTDALKNYVTERISRVKKYTDFNLNANITLGVEKHRNHIHAIIKGNGFYLNSEAEDPASMYKAIDHCVDKLETQLRRGKFNSHEKKTGKESIRQNVLAQAETLPVMDEETL